MSNQSPKSKPRGLRNHEHIPRTVLFSHVPAVAVVDTAAEAVKADTAGPVENPLLVRHRVDRQLKAPRTDPNLQGCLKVYTAEDQKDRVVMEESEEGLE